MAEISRKWHKNQGKDNIPVLGKSLKPSLIAYLSSFSGLIDQFQEYRTIFISFNGLLLE